MGLMANIRYERLEIHKIPSIENVPIGFWDQRVKEMSHPEFKGVFVLPNRDEAARFAAEKILEIVKEKPDAAFTLPSSNQGNSVLEKVVSLSKERGISFDQVQFFHLDEYFPITADNQYSFRANLREKIWNPLGIPKEHIHEIAANPKSDGNIVASNYEAELANIEIDLVLHPIGPDGHMGFNEAGTSKDSLTHLTKLSEKTLYRDHVVRGQDSPDYAITQGIATIMRAKKILFIDFSADYKEFMKDALYGPISEMNPSSLLRNVGQKVEVITTNEIASHILPAK